MKQEVIWKPVAEELPDEDLAVLICLDDGEVWTGFLESGMWRFISGDAVDQGDGTDVCFWAEFPPPPEISAGGRMVPGESPETAHSSAS